MGKNARRSAIKHGLAGGVVIFLLLAFVNEFSLFGQRC